MTDKDEIKFSSLSFLEEKEMPNKLNDNKDMRFVTFILTQNCNLNCSYCYEHHKTKNVFDVELIKEILSKELSINDNYSEICFDFFGGEPFLEFKKN